MMKNEIVEIENAIEKAQLNNDIGYFEQILSDDFQFITPQGSIVTKRQDIDQYKSGNLKMTKVESTDRTVNIYGTAAIVRFKVKFEGQAGKYKFSTFMAVTRAYSKDTGTWKMVAGHSSEIK